jgi:BirA family biotin operon repressor/biotin-[acetyl-CoA-carboxylase] ligase
LGELPKITLAAGVALCRAVRRLYSLAPQLKWPNDLLVNGRKCGGILVEADLLSQAEPLIILGIGLNTSTPLHSFPEELRESASSLHLHVQEPVLCAQLLEAVLVEADAVIGQFEKKGFADILEEWKQYDATLGKRLTWITTDHRVVEGVSLGPDNEGRLHIKGSDGVLHEVISGDIRLAAHS